MKSVGECGININDFLARELNQLILGGRRALRVHTIWQYINRSTIHTGLNWPLRTRI